MTISPSAVATAPRLDDVEEEEPSVLVRTSSLLAGPKPSNREHSGLLEKQKGTMRTWPQRYCFVKGGKFVWAEPSKRKEKGSLLLCDILYVEKKSEQDKPRQFVVKTKERTINFAALTEKDLDTWIEVLTPPLVEGDSSTSRGGEEAGDDEKNGPAKRFKARMIRSEEVVVTVRSNFAVEISKYVGGGFRMRLDELQYSQQATLDSDQAAALGLECDSACFVARGDEPWSATDAGVCFLSLMHVDDRQGWQDVTRSLSQNLRPPAAHARLAGWKLSASGSSTDQSLPLFSSSTAKALLESLDSWLHNERPELFVRGSNDERVRFPARYAPPPYALKDKQLLLTVTFGGGGGNGLGPTSESGNHNNNRIAVSCMASTTVDQVYQELLIKLDLFNTGTPAIREALVEKRCALRVAAIRSYLCRRDAPLLASADFVAALRNSVKPIPTVALVLETRLSSEEVGELAAAHRRLSLLGDRLKMSQSAPFPTNEIAAALRERPPNVTKLANMPDAQLEPYIPQLVQALKSEDLPKNPVARVVATPLMQFLLTRALLNPVYVGCSVFWALRSEMSKGGPVALRHGVLLATYLGAVGTKCRIDLEKQVVLDAQLRMISKAASSIDDKHARGQYAQRELRRLFRSGELPSGMDLPCMPGKRAGAIRPAECRVLSSKAAPILLSFDDDESSSVAGPSQPPSPNSTNQNETSRVLLAIFKTRDDLRQDAAMLQAMRQMDSLWLHAGHECWLRTYTVAATDVDVGWIEVVRDAKETAEIQSAKGGAFGAFQNDTLKLFLEEHNEDPKHFAAAQNRFAASCAACCVATYVLGIADRHNGNIMLSHDGRLFHIDFGHVLGHFKKLKGTSIKREKTKLVLTPEMMYVINEGNGVSMNAGFVKKCCDLIGVLREQGNLALLLQLIKELVPAELPEIDEDSIKWIVEVLLKPDAELKSELGSALSDWVRRLDNANHNRIHQSSGGGPNAGAKGNLAAYNAAQNRVATITEAQQEVEELREYMTLIRLTMLLLRRPTTHHRRGKECGTDSTALAASSHHVCLKRERER